jgi:hypothetical protein
MDYMPDLSAPKNVIIANTMALVVVTAIAVRLWMRRTSTSSGASSGPPPPPLKVGKFELQSKDFGGAAETRRDASRVFTGGGLLIDLGGDQITALELPAGMPEGVSTEEVDKKIEVLSVELRKRLGVELSSATFDSLLAMLTVNPSLGALAAAGEVPALKKVRCLVRAIGGQLHVLTVGYLMALPLSNQPQSAAPTDRVLTVASPDLLATPTPTLATGYTLTYALRHAACKSLDKELMSPGVRDVPGEPVA